MPDQVDERGRRLEVHNGHAPTRTLTMGAGADEVRRPRVDDQRFDPDTAMAPLTDEEAREALRLLATAHHVTLGDPPKNVERQPAWWPNTAVSTT
jgi:hypothetical protein